MYNKVDYLGMIHDALLDRSEFLQTIKVLLVFTFSCMLLSNPNVCLFFILPTVGLWAIESACAYKEALLLALFQDVEKKSVISSISMSVDGYKNSVVSAVNIALSFQVSFFYIVTCITAVAKFILCR